MFSRRELRHCKSCECKEVGGGNKFLEKEGKIRKSS